VRKEREMEEERRRKRSPFRSASIRLREGDPYLII
jgi:hypothetical protein